MHTHRLRAESQRHLYSTVGSEWMTCQYSVIYKDIKFLADKRSIFRKYHFDPSTIFFCILESIYMEGHEYMLNDPQIEDTT